MHLLCRGALQVTEIDVRAGRDGRWNDNNNAGEAGNADDMAGCYGCYGTFGNYPLCETHAPAHAANEIGQVTGQEYTTCLINTCHDFAQGGSGGKGCTGTYQQCCMPVRTRAIRLVLVISRYSLTDRLLVVTGRAAADD